jgi:hypothetical protein
VRLDNTHVSFTRLYSHERSALAITAYNPGQNPARISFINLPPHIQAEATPQTIRQGERAIIRITYDAARKNDWGFVSDRISMIVNDNRATDYKLTVTATIEEDFARWTQTQIQNAPVLSLDRQIVEAGRIKQGEKPTYTVKISNTGRGRLAIRKVESNSEHITINAPSEINAGASADISITFDTSGQNGLQNRQITLITNDPKNSQITIRLRADVFE